MVFESLQVSLKVSNIIVFKVADRTDSRMPSTATNKRAFLLRSPRIGHRLDVPFAKRAICMPRLAAAMTRPPIMWTLPMPTKRYTILLSIVQRGNYL